MFQGMSPAAARFLAIRRLAVRFAMFLTVICVMGFAAQGCLARQPVEVPDDPAVAAEAELLRLINEERERAGRAPLEHDPLLRSLARAKAEDMAVVGYFDHVSPTYGTVYDMLDDAGIRYKWAGENIARAHGIDVAHEALMASPDHRANILSAGYTHVGIGVHRSGNRWYVAQIFARPIESASRF